jgi:hypothetical protein
MMTASSGWSNVPIQHWSVAIMCDLRRVPTRLPSVDTAEAGGALLAMERGHGVEGEMTRISGERQRGSMAAGYILAELVIGRRERLS